LSETYRGLLFVELLGAANLRPADPNGLSDPYAEVSLGDNGFRSKTQPRTLNPRWGERHCLYIK
jgi:Ca2+-dependent lipid-binding protein